MKKYDVNTIIAYVNGDDTPGFEIEELENNYLFMFEVILYTNDKKMYNFCSDEVKCNFNFVKLLIKRYGSDIKFICDVADYFVENYQGDDKDNEIFEIALMIYNKLKTQKDKYEEKWIQYNMLVKGFYNIEMMNLEYSKSYLGEELASFIGKSFIFVLDDYSGSKLVLDYFAENLLDEILNEDVNDLERLLHEQFPTYADFKKYGEYKYLVELICKYDEALGNYISTDKKLLDNLRKQLKSIEKKWNSYQEFYLKEKYTLMFYVVEKYLQDENTDLMICYVGKELGILDQITKFEYGNDSETTDVHLSDAEFIKEQSEFEFFKTCRDIKKIMQDVLSNGDKKQIMEKYFNQDGTFNYNSLNDNNFSLQDKKIKR